MEDAEQDLPVRPLVGTALVADAGETPPPDAACRRAAASRAADADSRRGGKTAGLRSSRF